MEGKRLFEKRDFVGAIAQFQQAYRLHPHYAVQCSIARCYENLGQVVEAAQHYQRCLQEGADASPTASRIQRSLREAEARISFFEVVTPGRGGTLYLDGAPVGATPQRVRLNPGKHVIEVRWAGADPATRDRRRHPEGRDGDGPVARRGT